MNRIRQRVSHSRAVVLWNPCFRGCVYVGSWCKIFFSLWVRLQHLGSTTLLLASLIADKAEIHRSETGGLREPSEVNSCPHSSGFRALSTTTGAKNLNLKRIFKFLLVLGRVILGKTCNNYKIIDLALPIGLWFLAFVDCSEFNCASFSLSPPDLLLDLCSVFSKVCGFWSLKTSQWPWKQWCDLMIRYKEGHTKRMKHEGECCFHLWPWAGYFTFRNLKFFLPAKGGQQ